MKTKRNPDPDGITPDKDRLSMESRVEAACRETDLSDWETKVFDNYWKYSVNPMKKTPG